MRIIRVFPRRTSMTPTDDLAFVGAPPLLRPDADQVHVSCTFTWDRKEAVRLTDAWAQYYPSVIAGGAAWDASGGEFVPARYVRPGVTVTSRGCNNQCPWCLAWKREGKLREIEIHSGNNVIDNNLLQCSKAHIGKVIDMLRSQHAIKLSGGLDARLLTESVADTFRSLRIKEMFFACDTKHQLRALESAKRKLDGFTLEQLRCFVMIAYDGETMSEAEERLEAVWDIGFMPFAQLYQPPDKYIDYPKDWRRLAKNWSRPARTKALHGR